MLAYFFKQTQDNIEGLKAEADFDDHLIPLNEFYERYHTNPDKGLTEAYAEQMLFKEGFNVMTPTKTTPQWIIFCHHMFSGFAMILWAGATLCAVTYIIEKSLHDETPPDHLYLGIIMLIVVVISGLFSYFQDRSSSKIMDSFTKMVTHQATVIRDGKVKNIPTERLVRGDVVLVKFGNKVPADIRIIESFGMKVDNSSLTGETEPQPRGVEKTNNNPMETQNLAFFSSNVMEGTCKGVVFQVGDRTVIGRLAKLTVVRGPIQLKTVSIREDHLKQMKSFIKNEMDKFELLALIDRYNAFRFLPKTITGYLVIFLSNLLSVPSCGLKRDASPLTKEIRHFVRIITIVAVGFSSVFFVAGLMTSLPVIDCFLYFLAILIANVPEGLLVTVTLCLTLTAKKMAKKNCLIKCLDSVETLGSTSTICSDKTGTLTQNRMTVTEITYNMKTYEVNYGADKSSTVKNEFDVQNADFKGLVRCAQLCLRAEFESSDDDKPVLNRSVEGDASEAAILKCVECIFHNTREFRMENPKVFEIPFNSTNKYQLSIHRVEGRKNLLVMKGAPEKILELCSTISVGGGSETFTSQKKQEMEKILLTLGQKGERVLGFCDLMLGDPPGTEYSVEKRNFPTSNLRFLGLMALIDPPRETVPDAVQRCKTAGIRVIMVTGDHPVTAEAIARKVGIMSSETRKTVAERLGMKESDVPQSEVKAIVVSGDDLRVMSKERLDEILMNHPEIVFARTTPTQKLLIVEGCQRLGFITAVTGDGVNDSPALKKADIGIAMGITGSDVSKQAADMILLDDNFASIVTGVEEGRIIFDNLKKSITYLLTSNVPEMAPFMAFVLFQLPMPLSIMAVLIVDIGTDMVPAIALAYEKAESDIMLRRPRNPFYDKLVNRRLIWMAYGQIGIIQTMAGFCAYFVVYSEFGFLPRDLLGIRDRWENNAVNTVTDSYGQQWTYEARKRLESYAQSAFFAAIIVTQIADGIICKTRRNSIFQQGMSNWVLNGGLLFAVGLGCLLLYAPGVQSFILLPPLMFHHWLPGIPFAFAIFVFDEFRRLIIRKRPGGWVERETYY